jgi:hypothetical protein
MFKDFVDEDPKVLLLLNVLMQKIQDKLDPSKCKTYVGRSNNLDVTRSLMDKYKKNIEAINIKYTKVNKETPMTAHP